MKRKKYESAVLEITVFATSDIVTASGDDSSDGGILDDNWDVN